MRVPGDIESRHRPSKIDCLRAGKRTCLRSPVLVTCWQRCVCSLTTVSTYMPAGNFASAAREFHRTFA